MGQGKDEIVRRRKSFYLCMSSCPYLVFCTVARLQSQPHGAKGNINHNTTDAKDRSRLLVPESWRRRAFRHSLNEYASNAVCMPRIVTSIDSHYSVVNSAPPSSLPSSSPAGTGTTPERRYVDALSKLIFSIDVLITAVDDDFIITRTAIFRAAIDPLLLGLNLNPQDPLEFEFSSWRHLGADIEFNLPRVAISDKDSARRGRRSADAMRRAQPAYNIGAGFVLRGKKSDTDYEVLVTLDKKSMDYLLSAAKWRDWVREVVE